MHYKNVGYLVKEGFKSIYKNRIMVIISTLSIVAMLFVLGIMIIGLVNASSLMHKFEGQLQVTAYLKDSANNDTVNVLGAEIKSWKGVKSASFVTKQQALVQFRQQLGKNGDLLNGISDKENPFPGSFVINVSQPSYVKGIVDNLSLESDVDKISYSQEVVNTMQKVSNGMKTIGTGIIIILIIVSCIIINNTIRMAVMSKYKEIHIMKYIGASDWFIRWPFILQGCIIGILGSTISVIAVVEFYKYILGKGTSYINLFSFVPISGVIQPISASFYILGIGIGVLASIFSISKYLKV